MKQLLLLAFLSCGFLTGTAQQLRTAYFMDKATLRTSMNPALRPARGFISIPAAGSISATYASNGVALGDLLYQKDGRLVTFMDPSVPAESFLRGLKTNNQLNADIAAEIVSAGWFSGRGFWTIGIGVKGTVSGNVPKSLFEFMKYGSGPDGTTYDIEKLHVYTDSYVDVSVGYSRPLNDRWTIGGKYKFLVGAGQCGHPFHQPARRHERRLVADHFARTHVRIGTRAPSDARRRPKRPGIHRRIRLPFARSGRLRERHRSGSDL